LELKDQLDSKRLVKLKINKGVVSERSARSTIISEIEESTGSTSVFTRGNIAVFWKE
jgi:RNA-binding protein YhbY